MRSVLFWMILRVCCQTHGSGAVRMLLFYKLTLGCYVQNHNLSMAIGASNSGVVLYTRKSDSPGHKDPCF